MNLFDNHSYLKKQSRTELYIDLNDFELAWELKDVRKFDELWKKGLSLQQLAERFNRDLDEIAIHVIDRVRKGKIRKRENGYLGGKNEN